MDSVEQVMKGLSEAKRRCIKVMTTEWQPASAAISLHLQSPGGVCAHLADMGIFERKSDPEAWGRSVYRQSALGLEVRARLLSSGGEG